MESYTKASVIMANIGTWNASLVGGSSPAGCWRTCDRDFCAAIGHVSKTIIQVRGCDCKVQGTAATSCYARDIALQLSIESDNELK